jgi:hypothetical protein
LAFANFLRENGVDAEIDQYDKGHAGRDWFDWGPKQIELNELVICLPSPLFKHRWSGVSGSGVANEARAVRSKFESDNASVLFVILPGRAANDLPSDFRGVHHYELNDLSAQSLEPLLRAIFDAPSAPRPSLGAPPSFVTSPRTAVRDDAEQKTDPLPDREVEVSKAVLGSDLNATHFSWIQTQSAEHAGIIRDARSLANDQSFRALLSLASGFGILEGLGLRVQIGESYERLRFENCGSFGVRIHIETRGGIELSNVQWKGSAVHAFQSVTVELQKLDCFDISFDAEEILKSAIDCLELQISLRTEGRQQLGISTLIEPLRGPHPWVLTLFGIQSCEHGYGIARNRLNDKEFYWHVAGKSWVDTDQLWAAWELAKELFGESGPEYLREAIERRDGST